MKVSHAVTNEIVRQLLHRKFPACVVKSVDLLTGGLINTNLKIEFAANYRPVVLRIYRDGPEVCLKELAVHKLIESSVPIAKIIDAEPDGLESVPCFSILEFVDGISFHELKRTRNASAIAQASRSVGATLATIGQFQFDKPGCLVVEQNKLYVGGSFVDGPNPIPLLVEQFLESSNCKDRLGAKLIERIHAFVTAWSTQLPNLDKQHHLVHSDFGNKNIIVREQHNEWKVGAILDWEFAFSGSPLLDVGHFLRYEDPDEPVREPHFSNAFTEHGGRLPENWRAVVAVIDLTGLLECLTHDDLPAEVEVELLDLIHQTLKKFPA